MRVAFFTENTIADHEVVAAKTGYRIRVLGYCLSSIGTNTVTFKRASTELFSHYFVAGTNVPAIPGNSLDMVKLFETDTSEALNIALVAAVAVSGWVLYDYVS